MPFDCRCSICGRHRHAGFVCRHCTHVRAAISTITFPLLQAFLCAAAFHKPRIDFERAFDRSIYAAGQCNRLNAGFEVGFFKQDKNADQAVGSVFQDVIQNCIHAYFRTVCKDRVASNFYIRLKQIFQM